MSAHFFRIRRVAAREHRAGKQELCVRIILMLLALGATGYVLSQRKQDCRGPRNAAFAKDQPQDDDRAVRDAGPDAMRDTPRRDWSKVDETSDESFPASDPPGNY